MAYGEMLNPSYSDRSKIASSGDYSKNYQNMRPAGGQVNLDPNARKPSVVDGKSRLFGLSDENEYSGGQADPTKSTTGKRILGSQANTYHNVIGGSYSVGDDALKPQSTNKVNMMAYQVPPIQHH